MAFDREKMRAVMVTMSSGSIAGFKDKRTGHFTPVMTIRSTQDMDRFVETYDISVVSFE